MPAKPIRRSGVAIALATTIGFLVFWIPALAATPSLHVKGPKDAVTLNSQYSVKVSGTATHKANSLGYFEGGSAGGAQIKCRSTEQHELAAYPGSLHGPYKVHGAFTQTFSFQAGSTGHKALCAYLYDPPPGNFSGPTYAHASATWKVVQ